MTLPPAGFWERRELGRLESLLPRAGHDPLGPLAADHPFRAMAAAPAALTTSLAPSDVGSVTEARAFALARRGLHVLDGGLAALQELLLQRIRDLWRRAAPAARAARRGPAPRPRRRPAGEPARREDRLPLAALGRAFGGAAGHAGTLRAAHLSARAAGGPTGGRLPLRPVTHRRTRRGPAWHARAPAGNCRSGAPAHRGQRHRRHRRPPGAARAGSDPALDRMRRPGPSGGRRASYLRALRGRLLQTLERLWPELERTSWSSPRPTTAWARNGAATTPRHRPRLPR